MDPDLVRQQEEAEREALRAAQKRASEIKSAVPANTAQMSSNPGPVKEAVQIFAAADDTRSSAHASLGYDFLSGFGRFVSFAVAGAMLGIGLGNAATALLALPFHQAGTTILLTTGATAALFAFASLFTGGHGGARRTD